MDLTMDMLMSTANYGHEHVYSLEKPQTIVSLLILLRITLTMDLWTRISIYR